MRKILALLFVSFTISLYPQIQISSSNMPSIDDTIRYSISTTGSSEFLKTGANYSWDFSKLGLVSQDIYHYQKLSSTPYSTLLISGLPLGAIGYKVADSLGAGQYSIKNLYSFYEKKSSVWRAVGTGFTFSLIPFPAGAVYSDYDEIYTFPLSYNDKDSTTFAVTTPLGNQLLKLGTYTQKGYRVNHVEGWGTISTPYASNVACLKIKSRVVERDSINVTTPAFSQAFDANRVEYRWLSTTEKIPVLEVIGTELNGVFTPTQIRYRDNFRVLQNNPATPRARFSVDKVSGTAGKDTFSFTNNSFPPIGNTYQWSFSPDKGIRYVSGTSASSENPRMIFDSSGLYSVNLRATNLAGFDDSSATDLISISKASGIQSTFSSTGLKVYPNPATQSILISEKKLVNSIYRIFDSSGKLVMSGLLPENGIIEIGKLSAGTYNLLFSGTDFIQHTQIIIQ